MKQFATRLSVFMLVMLCVMGIISYLAIRLNNTPEDFLYRYQLQKLMQKDPVTTLFIGDSSLGNCIDSREFSGLSSQPSLNCALNGLFGYSGPYNVMRAAYRYHPELKNVVIMSALDMQTREATYAGYVRTAKSLSSFLELSNYGKKNFIKEMYYYVRSCRFNNFRNYEEMIVDDYMKQGPKKTFTAVTDTLFPKEINPAKNRFLLKMVRYCTLNHLNLVYVHGPVYSGLARVSGPYIRIVNRNISSTGIRLVPEVIRVDNSDLGDSEDHIRPGLKKKYTALYYNLLKDYLRK